MRGDVQAAVPPEPSSRWSSSAWQSFSPYTYGWGFPLLLAPLYAVFGHQLHRLQEPRDRPLPRLPHRRSTLLIRDRIDRLAALLIIAALVLDNLYTAWTNTVLTEFPFLCFSVAQPAWSSSALHAPERLASVATDSTRAWSPWPALGALIGFTINIRNEGIVLLAALAARQLVVVVEPPARVGGAVVGSIVARPGRAVGRRRRGRRSACALVLPTDSGRALKLSGGLGGHNFATNDGFYRQTLAELLAVKDRVHGTLLLGLLVFLIVLALGGMILGGRRDLPLSVFTLGLAVDLPGAALPGGPLPARRGALPPLLRHAGPAGHRRPPLEHPAPPRPAAGAGGPPRPGHGQRRRLLAHLPEGHRRSRVARCAGDVRRPSTPTSAPGAAGGVLPPPGHEPLHRPDGHHRRAPRSRSCSSGATGTPWRRPATTRSARSRTTRPPRPDGSPRCGRTTPWVLWRVEPRAGPPRRPSWATCQHAACDRTAPTAGAQPARRPGRPARPRGHRGQHLPRRVTRTRAASGSSAARSPARRSWRRRGRSTTPAAWCTRCTPTSCARATPPCPSSTRSTASGTAGASPPAGWSPSSTARPSSTSRPASTATEPGLDHQVADGGRRCPTRASLPDFATRMAPHRERLGEWYDRPRPIDTRYVDTMPSERRGPAAPRAAGLAPGRRPPCPTTPCSTPASSPTRRT